MIYSPDHNFLLLKNRKVGGSSLELVLSRVLPKNAIVTKLTSPTNTTDPVPDWHKERNYGEDNRFYHHMKYEEVKKYIDLSEVKSYVFVRNPYHSVLSAFFHRLSTSKILLKSSQWNSLSSENKKRLVKDYFDSKIGDLPWYKSDKYIYLNSNNELLVDKVLYYENGIENEINPILKNHQIPEIQIDVNFLNHRPKKITYNEIFKEEHLDLIRNEWWWEFENLGYNI
jgi:hypothetical protein